MVEARALVGRFATDLRSLVAEPSRLGIAVSGGADSVALLLLAAASMPGRIAAATVDHGLRPESADEARCVAALCEARGLPHATLRVEVLGGGEGVQGEARRARHLALGNWCAREGIEVLATAHHADDQAETLLMRLQRGSGLSGLAGVRAVRREGSVLLVRPLLGWTKAELGEVVEAAGVTAIDDPSNHDRRFDRAEMRAFLAENPQFLPRRLAASAAALADAEAAIEWTVEQLWKDRVGEDGQKRTLDPSGLPAEFLRRLVVRLVAAGETRTRPRGEEIARLIATLEAGDKGTLGGFVCTGGAIWIFAPAPLRGTA